MVGAPATEVVNKTASIQCNWELLTEAELELLDREETILVHVEIFDCAPHFCRLIRFLGHDWRQVLFIDLIKPFELHIFLLLNLFLLNSNQVINALGLLCQPGGYEILYVHKTLIHLIWVVLYVLVNLIAFKEEAHLLTSKRGVSELLKQLAQFAKRSSVLRLDQLAREKLPLLAGQLLRNQVEEVDTGVFHNFLVQRAIRRPGIV